MDVAALRTNLAELRIRRGWSQGDLGKAAGVRADTVSSIERGKHEPRPSTLRKLADALGVEVADLFSKGPEASTEGATPSTRASGERGILNASAAGVGRGASSAQGELTTVGVSVELLWRVYEAAEGGKKLEPDERRQIREALVRD